MSTRSLRALVAGLHLAALWSFAVLKPLLDVVSDGAARVTRGR